MTTANGSEAYEGPADPEPPSQVPPHDLEAEAAVLSACLIDGARYDEVADLLAPVAFFSEAHRRIYEAVGTLRAEGKPVDVVTVCTWIRDAGRIAQVGGVAYVTEILNAAPAIANVRAYAEIVVRKARAREMIAAAQRIVAEGYAGGDELAFVQGAEHAVSEIAARAEVRPRGRMVGAIVRELWREASAAAERGRPPGVPTGLHLLDNKTRGLHRKELTLVGARPGMGKTGWLLTIARNVALAPRELWGDDGQQAQPQGVAIFSVEMPEDACTARMVAMGSGVSARAFREGAVDDWGPVTKSANDLSAAPIWIDDTPALPIALLRSKVRRIRADFARKGVRLTLVVVDYVQLMRGMGDERNRDQELGVISRGLAATAKEEDVALVAAVQLSRSVEERKEKRPELRDLRESGNLEQDAHNVLFLFRPEYYGETQLPEHEGLTEVIIAKQREGPTCIVYARYQRRTTGFVHMEEP